MSYIAVNVDVDVDIEHVIDNMSQREVEELTASLIESGYGKPPRVGVNLENESDRLEAIVWLRQNGYTVEPGGK